MINIASIQYMHDKLFHKLSSKKPGKILNCEHNEDMLNSQKHADNNEHIPEGDKHTKITQVS